MITAIITICSVALVALAFIGVFVPNWNNFIEFIQNGITILTDVLPAYVPSFALGIFSIALSVFLFCKIINR